MHMCPKQEVLTTKGSNLWFHKELCDQTSGMHLAGNTLIQMSIEGP